MPKMPNKEVFFNETFAKPGKIDTSSTTVLWSTMCRQGIVKWTLDGSNLIAHSLYGLYSIRVSEDIEVLNHSKLVDEIDIGLFFTLHVFIHT